MMAGEIEYENFIYENGEAIFPFTGHFMILLFVVLISIILMNLLVGLAVSDIQVTEHSEYIKRIDCLSLLTSQATISIRMSLQTLEDLKCLLPEESNSTRLKEFVDCDFF